MAHSQKSIRDHARNRSHPNVDNKAIAQQLEDLLKKRDYQERSLVDRNSNINSNYLKKNLD